MGRGTGDSVCASVVGADDCRYREVRRTVHKSGAHKAAFRVHVLGSTISNGARRASDSRRSFSRLSRAMRNGSATVLAWSKLASWGQNASRKRRGRLSSSSSTIRPRGGVALCASVPAGFSGSSSRLSCNMRGMSASTTLVASEHQGSSTSDNACVTGHNTERLCAWQVCVRRANRACLRKSLPLKTNRVLNCSGLRIIIWMRLHAASNAASPS